MFFFLSFLFFLPFAFFVTNLIYSVPFLIGYLSYLMKKVIRSNYPLFKKHKLSSQHVEFLSLVYSPKMT
jgi:hypothetical protein